MTGGDAHVLPTANPDQLALFSETIGRGLDGRAVGVSTEMERAQNPVGAMLLHRAVSSASFQRPPGTRCPVRHLPAEADGMDPHNPREAQKLVRTEL
jgi:hypothetical protein